MVRDIKDHSRFVFADKKTMKEIDIYGKVRQNIMTGDVPNHSMEANARNR